MSQSSSGGWMIIIIVSILMTLVTGLTTVWLSIERADTAFQIGRLQAEVDKRIALKAKLEVERDKFLSPFELGRRAVELDMREARPGQIRKLHDPALQPTEKQ